MKAEGFLFRILSQKRKMIGVSGLMVSLYEQTMGKTLRNCSEITCASCTRYF